MEVNGDSGHWSRRLDEALQERGWTVAEFSRRSGVPEDSLYKYLDGKTDQPRGERMDKMAKALGVPTIWLKDGFVPADLRRVPLRYHQIPILGEVAAGLWLEVDDALQPTGETLEAAPGNLPENATFGLRVKGDSINKIAPEGSTLVCIDINKAEVEIREHDLVIVEQIDPTGKREVTAKRVKKVGDATVLTPDSTNPRWQPVKLNGDTVKAGNIVRVLAKVEYILKRP